MTLRRDTDLKLAGIGTQASEVLAGLVASRISCRRFKPEAVPDAVIERILTLSQFAPSWCNTQPWEVIITTGEGTERIRSGLVDDLASNPESAPDLPFPERYAGKFLDRKREVAWQLYSSLGIARGDREASGRAALENFHLFGAPHVAIITSERDLGVYGALDCAYYGAYFGLAAQSLGVATITQAALAQRAPFLRGHFHIPDSRLVVAGISFGYADLDHPANNFLSQRAELAEGVSWVRA